MMSLLGSYWVAEPETQFTMASWPSNALDKDSRESKSAVLTTMEEPSGAV